MVALVCHSWSIAANAVLYQSVCILDGITSHLFLRQLRIDRRRLQSSFAGLSWGFMTVGTSVALAAVGVRISRGRLLAGRPAHLSIPRMPRGQSFLFRARYLPNAGL